VSDIRVLIVDDEDAIREALADLIASEGSLEVVGTARDVDEAVQVARSTRPDVALVDVKMPGGGGPRAAREILRWSPQTHVLALSAYEDRTTVLEMLGSGAVGYLVKGTSPDEIVAAIERAVRGQASLSTEVMAGVVHELTNQLRREGLSAAEEQIRVDRIRRAVAGTTFTIVFQPIFDLRDGRVAGAEALARFNGEPIRPPDQWFREAASVGLGVDLELAAVAMALTQAMQLPPDTYLALNLSHRTAMSPRLLDMLTNASIEFVMIELTEHERVEDYEALDAALGALRSIGVRLAIDDAGAGYSSLRHILALDPDIIKLDISITHRIDKDRRRRALARALVAFAQEMEAAIVAEGIESREELDALLELGVHFGQGFYLARPAPLPLPEAAAGT
jgi:EAL domain-containing protein (putative c-di-GMP-specific phosphodiesterase class I)/CheY-like chemotaxis protein